MTLIGNSDLENNFEFDSKNQKIILAQSPFSWLYKRSKLPESIEEFTENGKFNTTKYFNTFVEEMLEAVESGKIKLPEGLRLSTEYIPCEICRSHEDIIPQDVRCRHEPNCQDHKKRKDDPDHKETCNCRVFSSPSISFTKIGIAIHLEFDEPDGTKFNLDVDVSPPTIPVTNVDQYEGDNKKKREWLEKNRSLDDSDFLEIKKGDRFKNL